MLSRVRHVFCEFFIKFVGVVIKYYRKLKDGCETLFMAAMAGLTQKG